MSLLLLLRPSDGAPVTPPDPSDEAPAWGVVVSEAGAAPDWGVSPPTAGAAPGWGVAPAATGTPPTWRR